MKVEQYLFNADKIVSNNLPAKPDGDVDLVLLYASGKAVNDKIVAELTTAFPNAEICGASTAGEIHGREVHKDSLSATAINFNSSRVQVITKQPESAESTTNSLQQCITELPKEGLKSIWIFVDGKFIRHSRIMSDIISSFPEGVKGFGGFAGTEEDQEFCSLATKEGWKKKSVQAVGIYGDAIKTSYSVGGQGNPFGPARVATKSKDGVLYELDGKPALDLLKSYFDLGKDESIDVLAQRRFHFVVREKAEDEGVVRGPVDYLEEERAIAVGGDIAEGSLVSLSMVTKDGLVENAATAAQTIKEDIDWKPELLMAVSCVSRIIYMGQEIDDEVEAACEEFADNVPMSGFYSFGELGPNSKDDPISLHNETFCLLAMSEGA